MKFPRAMYSLSTSFCVVPRSSSSGQPCSSPTSEYSASSTVAGALIVIDVEIALSGMPSKTVRMSSIVSIDTPVRPTSPRQRWSSESRPSWVGRSKAIERPVEPCARRYL